MPDKQLLRLLGEDKRYIYRAVAWMLTGSLCGIGFTACLCYGLHLLLTDAKAPLYLIPFILGAVCAAESFLPLRAFGSAFHVAMNGVSAGRMMLTLLEEPEPAWGKVQPCGGRLQMRGALEGLRRRGKNALTI